MAKQSTSYESEHHVVGVRLRAVGEGDLQLTLSDLDDVRSFDIAPLPLSPTNRIEPTRLANFQSQRIRLTGEVTEFDEYFRIQRIIIFAKPVAMEYPGGGVS